MSGVVDQPRLLTAASNRYKNQDFNEEKEEFDEEEDSLPDLNPTMRKSNSNEQIQNAIEDEKEPQSKPQESQTFKSPTFNQSEKLGQPSENHIDGLPTYPLNLNADEAGENSFSLHKVNPRESSNQRVFFESANFSPDKNTIDVRTSNLHPSSQNHITANDKSVEVQEESPKSQKPSTIQPLYFFVDGQKQMTNKPEATTTANPKLDLQNELEPDS